MKMSRNLYAQLRQDICEVAQSVFPEGLQCQPDMPLMWSLFRHVQRDRMNDDTHPWFESGAYIRVLPFWSPDGKPRRLQGNDHWLNQFYKTEGLNDTHIGTALRRIAKDLPILVGIQ